MVDGCSQRCGGSDADRIQETEVCMKSVGAGDGLRKMSKQVPDIFFQRFLLF